MERNICNSLQGFGNKLSVKTISYKLNKMMTQIVARGKMKTINTVGKFKKRQ